MFLYVIASALGSMLHARNFCRAWCQVDAMDYDRRLQAYSALKPEAWAAMAPVQALPLLHQSLSDMRRPDDLAIRSAAAQALGRLIAAASADAVSAQRQGGEHARGQRYLFKSFTSGILLQSMTLGNVSGVLMVHGTEDHACLLQVTRAKEVQWTLCTQSSFGISGAPCPPQILQSAR